MDDFVHFHLRLNRSTFYFSPPPSTSKRLPLFLQVENERKRNVRPRVEKNYELSIRQKERGVEKGSMQRDWHESVHVGTHTHTHTRHRIHRYKCQTAKGRRGIRPVSRPHRKVQSTGAQRCIGNAPIRGQFALCSLREGDGWTKGARCSL